LPARRWAGIVAFALVAGLTVFTPLRTAEISWGLGALYAARGERPAPPRVSVVALNTRAADALGVPARADRWPRSLHAELIERLQGQGAAVVGFDLLFERPREPADDARLAAAMQGAGNVVLVEYLRRDKVPSGATVATIDRRIPPMPLFSNAALATAPFVLTKAPEGVFDYLAFAPEGDDLPTLPLVMAAAMEPLCRGPAAGGGPARTDCRLAQGGPCRPGRFCCPGQACGECHGRRVAQGAGRHRSPRGAQPLRAAGPH
jgi:adenylate cyclase